MSCCNAIFLRKKSYAHDFQDVEKLPKEKNLQFLPFPRREIVFLDFFFLNKIFNVFIKV